MSIAYLTALCRVDLQHCSNITGEYLTRWQHCVASPVRLILLLATLVMLRCLPCAGAGFAAWGSRMPFLSHLCAQNGERIEDVALKALARLTTLRSLNLKGCRCVTSGQTTPSPLLQLAAWARSQTPSLGSRERTKDADAAITGLRTAVMYGGHNFLLSLCGRRLTDAGILELEPLQQLRELSLQGNQAITDAGLVGLARLQSLESLDLQLCWQVHAVLLCGLACQGSVACSEHFQQMLARRCCVLSAIQC